MWSTFSIYFVVFEKKVFNFFSCSKMAKSFTKCLTVKPKKLKNDDFFRFFQIASKCQEMIIERCQVVLWTRNTLFPLQNTFIRGQKKFSNVLCWNALTHFGQMPTRKINGRKLVFFSKVRVGPLGRKLILSWVENSL